YLRFINLVTAIVTCVMSALVFLGSLTTGGDASAVVLTFYVFSFGVMICCFELQLKAVAQYIAGNFGFFFSPHMRSMFLVFVALLCFDLGLFGMIVGAMLCFVACLNFYALCMFPEYIQAPAVSAEQKAKAAAQASGAASQFAFKAATAGAQQPAFTNV
ncbi:hypothetical protein TeGR_g7771, partial [Tetraparma gracilis]